MLQNILVPIDGSENAWKALEAARGLAEKYQGDLVVLTVPYGKSGMMLLSMDQEVIKNDRKELALIGNAILEEAQKRLKDFAGNVSYKLKAGNPAQTILDQAEAEKCDTIVIGSRGLSGIKEFFMGSVSSKVSQYGKVPVLIVK